MVLHYGGKSGVAGYKDSLRQFPLYHVLVSSEHSGEAWPWFEVDYTVSDFFAAHNSQAREKGRC